MHQHAAEEPVREEDVDLIVSEERRRGQQYRPLWPQRPAPMRARRVRDLDNGIWLLGVPAATAQLISVLATPIYIADQYISRALPCVNKDYFEKNAPRGVRPGLRLWRSARLPGCGLCRAARRRARRA